MALLIGFFTLVLVVTCLLLILLILIQLPKKEAGAGQAFGGGTTDALFGAGSGNVLTKVTKYAAATFLGLSLVLSVLHAHRSGATTQRLEEELKKKATAPLAITPPASTNTVFKTTMAATNAPTNTLLISTNAVPAAK